MFKYKYDTDGYLNKFKARICVRGDLQNTQQDTYAATLAYRTFRALMAITAAFDLEIVQLDAVNAFLNSDINEEIYVHYPEGFKQPGQALRLRRALYGLRQSPLLWYEDLTETLKTLGLVPILDANCLLSNGAIIVFFYVDDIIVLYHAKDSEAADNLLRQLQQRYQMRRMKDANWFLGIRIIRDRATRRLWLCQDSYIDKLASKFDINCGARLPDTPLVSGAVLLPYEGQASQQEIYGYQQRIGSINFPAITTRPDIAKPCSILSQFLQNPGPIHQAAADRVIAYLVRTKHLAIEYSGQEVSPERPQRFECYSDAAFADNLDRRSSDGYLFLLYGGPVDWKASKQKTVTTSSTEAELLALSQAGKEAIQWRRILDGIEFSDSSATIKCDNLQTIRLLTKSNPQLATRLKHVDIHTHWLRQEVQEGRIAIEWTPTASMRADGFTKLLPGQRFKSFIKQLNLVDIQDRL